MQTEIRQTVSFAYFIELLPCLVSSRYCLRYAIDCILDFSSGSYNDCFR